MKTSQLNQIPSYAVGDLVWVAGEMLVKEQTLGRMLRTLFAFAQLGLVVESNTCPYSSEPYITLWFAEFGTHKEKEHVLARAPLGKETTKVWIATRSHSLQ